MFKVGDRVRSKKTGRLGTVSFILSDCVEVTDAGLFYQTAADNIELISSGPAVANPAVGPCMHSFKSYVGFTHVYDYCVHCDEKRDVPK